MDFETVWKSIKEHEGEVFTTIRGLPFTYEVIDDDYLIIYREGKPIKAKLTSGNFYRAFQFDWESDTAFNKSIIGSSYVKAILYDDRINYLDFDAMYINSVFR